MADPPMSQLERLPAEILLAIVQHISPSPPSLRPFASLAALSRSSRALHPLIAPLVDQRVQLSTLQQARRFIRQAPTSIQNRVRHLALARSNSWTFALLEQLVHSLPGLTDLSVDGLAPSKAERVLQLLAQRNAVCPLRRLDLDLALSSSSSSSSHSPAGLATPSSTLLTDTNARADHPLPVPLASPGAESSEEELFSLSRLNYSHSLPLPLLESLSHLRLANVDLRPASAVFFPEGLASSSTSLRSLELEGVVLSDELLSLFLSGAKLESLVLSRCSGFTRAGLVEAGKNSGGRLTKLDLEAAKSSSFSTSGVSTPLASPRRSPPLLSASIRSPTAASLGCRGSPSLVGILDVLLPFLPHLTHLSSTGPLISPSCAGRLSSLVPYLRHLTLTSNPHLSPSSLLPLLSPSSPAFLPCLDTLSFQPSPSLPCPSLPWSSPPPPTSLLEICVAARTAGVSLVGAGFAATQERLEWGEREAEKLALAVEGEHLVTVPGVQLSHLNHGDSTLLFEGTIDLILNRSTAPSSRSTSPLPGAAARRAPPPLPPRPDQQATPPPPSYASLAPTSPSHDFLTLSLSLPGSPEPVFSMPISLADPASSIIAQPPASYVLPNLHGFDSPFSSSSSASSATEKQGFIKLTLSVSPAPNAIDPETRELFEASLYGLYRGQTSSAPSSGVQRPENQPQREQLYLVDETTGRVLGALAGGHAVRLEEDRQLKAGQMDDKPYQLSTNALNTEGHEPVVIEDSSLVAPLEPPSSSSTALTGPPSVTYTVKPVSAYYSPAANPQNSQIVSAGNFLSHGIIIGSQLLARTFESSAGKYVSSRPATQSPMVFSENAKAWTEKGHRVTSKATVYSGKAAQAVGGLAAKVGDRIGKSTGIQSQAGGPPPTGWRGALASTLTAVNTVADHLEAGGKTILESGSKSASSVVHHKYGAEARGVADNVGGSVKHCALVYIDARGVGRKALLKSVGKSALRAKMADGSEVILSNENGELKQIETAATSGGNVPLAIEGNVTGSTTPVTAPTPPRARSPLPAYGGGGGGGGMGRKEKGT
ncbi:hypothetical protein JCM8547_006160 [Rhodosporidiobolus lusitaniae]